MSITVHFITKQISPCEPIRTEPMVTPIKNVFYVVHLVCGMSHVIVLEGKMGLCSYGLINNLTIVNNCC